MHSGDTRKILLDIADALEANGSLKMKRTLLLLPTMLDMTTKPILFYLLHWKIPQLADGLILEKTSSPLGFLLIVFESRSDALVQVTENNFWSDKAGHLAYKAVLRTTLSCEFMFACELGLGHQVHEAKVLFNAVELHYLCTISETMIYHSGLLLISAFCGIRFNRLLFFPYGT
ncbi:hypothetical protein V6N11_082730 [Hibiscus sabdariffa]|uniref:Uncharacterized protein n=1 Tax=Hibiscus sabdariffa TaxID=183260 RepID=A0ABR2QJX7_9ROSI